MDYHYYRLVGNFTDYFTVGDKVSLNTQRYQVSQVDKGVIELTNEQSRASYCIDDLYDIVLYKDGIHYLPLD